jgi:hypothetical protein
MPKPARQYETIPLMVRMPVDVRRWLERQAERSAGSMGSEVVRAIRDAMDRQERAQRAESREAANG